MNHCSLRTVGAPTPGTWQRMLSTLNNYYGMFGHARSYRLRKHFYHHELGPLQSFFLPANKDYSHLLIRKAWTK